MKLLDFARRAKNPNPSRFIEVARGSAWLADCPESVGCGETRLRLEKEMPVGSALQDGLEIPRPKTNKRKYMKGFNHLRTSLANISHNARQGAVALGAVCALLFIVSAPQTLAKPKPANSINLIPTIQSISVVNGHLVASGVATAVIQGKTTTVPFTAPVDIQLASDQSSAGACPILDLSLGPITLDLLGLVVETSPICLKITAFDNGGLLGDLLCAVANLLNGGLSLQQILAGQGLLGLPGLTPAQIGQLLTGVTNLLNGALPRLLDAVLMALLPGGPHACAILHLELGPLNLNLLGLEVILDDCSGGPVTVDITAERGRGNLLGNLLCGLLGDGLISLGSTLQAILNQILAIFAL
jgi:hypothetical protein